MSITIGQAKIAYQCRELEHYFDKNISHSWSGPTTFIKSIIFVLDMDVNAIIASKSSGVTANVNFSVRAVITDQYDRIIERHMSVPKFKESYERGSYSCGWHDEPNQIELNQEGQSLMIGTFAQAAA